MPLFKKKSPEDNVPSSYKYISEYLIVCENYKCRKNSKKKRADIIKKMKIGDNVSIELFFDNKKPTYMVIDPKSKLDIGELSYGASGNIYGNYKNANFYIFISDSFKNSFHVKIYADKKG